MRPKDGNVIVYALVDSREPTVFRYVGVTKNDLSYRLSSHRSDANWRKRHPSRLAQWIREVRNNGGTVDILALAEVTADRGLIVEGKFIVKHKNTIINQRVHSSDGWKSLHAKKLKRSEASRQHPYPCRIGNLLDMHMRKKGMTQIEMADELGLTGPYLSKIMYRRRLPTPKWLDIAATALGLSEIECRKLHLAGALDRGYRLNVRRNK